MRPGPASALVHDECSAADDVFVAPIGGGDLEAEVRELRKKAQRLEQENEICAARRPTTADAAETPSAA